MSVSFRRQPRPGSQPPAKRSRKAPRAIRAALQMQQIKALIASTTRDAVDVDREFLDTSGTVCCLTSSASSATAGSTTGLLPMDGDSCFINSVRLKGWVNYPCYQEAVTYVGMYPAWIRKLVVWFYKPLLVASAAGTLPPITEVLTHDSIDSFPVTAAANGGRFVVLADRLWCLGQNGTFGAAPYTSYLLGQPMHYFDFTVQVNKTLNFKASPTAANPGGHYSSSVDAGRVVTGLLVCYTQVVQSSSFGAINDHMHARLNFTG